MIKYKTEKQGPTITVTDSTYEIDFSSATDLHFYYPDKMLGQCRSKGEGMEIAQYHIALLKDKFSGV